jgi:hypothetical protein
MPVTKFTRVGGSITLIVIFFLAIQLKDSTASEPDSQRLMKSSTNFWNSDLRILTFGSSRSWGANIKHPERDSFPALLQARNLAIRASGPEYPAVCTYSMVGEEVYDVIVIEYMLDFVSEALNVLAHRLRTRFPDATLIFLNIWAPRQYTYIPTGETLNTIVRPKRIENPNRTALEYVTDIMIATKPEDWKFTPYNRKIIEDVAAKVDGIIIDLPMDIDPLQALSKAVPLYLFDMTHFSELGHVWVRDMILEVISSTQAKPTKRVLPWEYSDQCYSWFQTGKVDFIHNMKMIDFGSGSKFALKTNSPPQKNFIEIQNVWNSSAFLFLSFMRFGPEQIYPDVLVEVDQNGIQSCANVVFPRFDDTPFGLTLHVVNHALIGKINPGNSKLTITELTKGQRENFLIVGIMLSLKEFGGAIFADL